MMVVSTAQFVVPLNNYRRPREGGDLNFVTKGGNIDRFSEVPAFARTKIMGLSVATAP
jgi:hypothetical protein